MADQVDPYQLLTLVINSLIQAIQLSTMITLLILPFAVMKAAAKKAKKEKVVKKEKVEGETRGGSPGEAPQA